MFLFNGKKIALPTTGYGIGDDGTSYPGACPGDVSGINHPAGSGPLYTEDGRAGLGIIEVPDPVRADERFNWVTENEDGTLTVTPKDLAPLKAGYKDQIDQACGVKRAAAVSRGAYIDEEYRRAYEDALAYKAIGYSGGVPASVQSWATVAGLTAQQAADDIILTRDGYMALLDAIRDIRLTGKAMIDVATAPADILASVEFINASLDALP